MNSAQVGAPIGEGREQKDAIDEEVGISFKHILFIRFIDKLYFIYILFHLFDLFNLFDSLIYFHSSFFIYNYYDY